MRNVQWLEFTSASPPSLSLACELSTQPAKHKPLTLNSFSHSSRRALIVMERGNFLVCGACG